MASNAITSEASIILSVMAFVAVPILLEMESVAKFSTLAGVMGTIGSITRSSVCRASNFVPLNCGPDSVTPSIAWHNCRLSRPRCRRALKCTFRISRRPALSGNGIST